MKKPWSYFIIVYYYLQEKEITTQKIINENVD